MKIYIVEWTLPSEKSYGQALWTNTRSMLFSSKEFAQEFIEKIDEAKKVLQISVSTRIEEKEIE